MTSHIARPIMGVTAAVSTPQGPATSTGLEPAREAITEYERGYMAGVLVGGADGGRIARLLQMVLDDMGICRGELGSGYEFQELSSETVEALDTAYREAMKPRAPQPPAASPPAKTHSGDPLNAGGSGT